MRASCGTLWLIIVFTNHPLTLPKPDESSPHYHTLLPEGTTDYKLRFTSVSQASSFQVSRPTLYRRPSLSRSIHFILLNLIFYAEEKKTSINCILDRSQGSSVDTLTRPWGARPRNRDAIPDRGKRLFSSAKWPDRACGPSSLTFNSHWVIFHLEENGRACSC
jgi:hypothetical protein